jgi:hypothetical protein
MAGQRVTRESQVIQLGKYVAHALRLGGTPGISGYELDENGEIAGQWVFMN